MATTPDGDNRWTAILSTDLAGFTEISQRIGSERVYELLTHVLELARTAIEDHEGHVVDTAGDGILAAFGAPKALENASLHCCRAAVQFHTALEAEREELEAAYGTQIQFRTGISGHNTMVARQEGNAIKVIGAAVNMAARLQALAAPGETLISDSIRLETEGFVETEDRGKVTLKGFEGPVQAHSLIGLAQTPTQFDGARRRGLSDLVSRQSELALIAAALAGETARPFVLLRGPPGIGKSRLAHEACEATPRRTFVGQCRPTGSSVAYAPFLEIFRQFLGAPWGEEPSMTVANLLALYPELGDEAARLDVAESHKNQTDSALRRRSLYRSLLQNIVRDSDAVLVIEDAHWIDPGSSALLADIAARGVCAIVTARPEFDADWINGDSVLEIDLQPLNAEGICQIAEGVLKNAVAPGLADLISNKAEGVPLVAEEIARALAHSGQLSVTDNGSDLVGDPGVLMTGNLEQLVLARIDRLGEGQKITIRFAAAIGRDFTAQELDAALGRSGELDELADEPGLIEAMGAGRWRFTHALIRDAVYSSLLSTDRKMVHLEIARAMVESERSGGEQPGVVAQHFLRSFEPDRAAPFLVRAAEQSLGAYALQEADRLLEQAAELLKADPAVLDEASYADMAVIWLRAMDGLGDFGRGLQISERMLPRLEAAGYSSALSIARMLRTIALAHAWRYDEAERLARTTLEEADGQNDAWGAAWAKVALLRILDESKRATAESLEKLVAEIEPVAEETGDRHMAMTAIYLLSSAYRSSGRRIDALAQADRIEAFSQTHNDQRARAYSGWARALIFLVENNIEKAHLALLDVQGHAAPGSGDERVSLGIEFLCGAFLSPPGTYDARINALGDEGRRMVDRNMAQSMDWVGAMADLRCGELARGWRKLDALERNVGPTGNRNVTHQVLVARAEVLLALAGLTDPRSEEPPERKAYPRKRPGLADLLVFARLRLRALKLAERAMNASLNLSDVCPSPYVSRFRIGLGLIRAARKDWGAARSMLEEGLVLAEREGMDILANRARKALDRLPEAK